MADDIVLNAGSGGSTLATDEVNSKHYQYIKLVFGPDDTISKVAAGTPLPVDVISALPAGTNAIGKLVANSGVDIGDVDILSVIPGTGASNLGKAEDSAHTSADVGVMSLVVRRDADTTLVGADGDYSPLQVNVNGALKVEIFDGGDSFTVDNGGTFVIQEDGAALTALQLIDNIVLAEDTVHSSGDSGVMALVVRNDTLGALAGADGDYAPLQVNASGALYTDVVALVPGTGATALGKAIDSPVGSTDTGILILAVHDGEASKISVAEEDYDHLHIGELGGLSVEPEQHNHLDEFDVTTGWTVLGNDTLNLATTTNHLTGSNALTFDKVDGAANTVFAGIQKTITTVDMGELDLHDIVQTVCYVSSSANIDYIFVRIGTDSTNYNEWRISGDDIGAGDFQILGLTIGSASQSGNTGNGVNWGSISYIAVGVAFDNQNNTLSGIIFDQLGLFTGHHVSANISAEVSSSVSSPNVNVKKWGSTNVTLNAGNSDTGTLRVVLATDQNFTKLEDAVHGSGDAGIMALVVRNDVLAALSGADGDYAGLQVSADGGLYVHVAPLSVGGASMFRDIDLDETDVAIKTSAGTLFGGFVTNLSSATRYIQLYDAATGDVTVGSTTAFMTIPLEADQGAVLDFGAMGIAFGTAITIAATTDISGSGAPGTNDVVVNLSYK